MWVAFFLIASNALANDQMLTKPANSTYSHRLIVELRSPPLIVALKDSRKIGQPKINLKSSRAIQLFSKLEAEKQDLFRKIAKVLPSSNIGSFCDEKGKTTPLTFSLLVNAMVIDPGKASFKEAKKTLLKFPEIKKVYHDYAHYPLLHSSNSVIQSSGAWNHASIGGQANAGSGIKIASVDGGIHKDAPMFDGTGYVYPPGFPSGGLGLTENNNGKIIASRAYFRSWDLPTVGDENPWPGTNGTSHGVSTSSIAGGNIASAAYAGLSLGSISGVAPAAWVMSYRVFYPATSGFEGFYTAEGLAALEDIASDGADIVNNSWGGGQEGILDQALINTVNAGIFVSMSAGNGGPYSGTTNHPSQEYITVGATTSSARLQLGRVDVTAPFPIPANLENLVFSTANFGVPVPYGDNISFPWIPSAIVDGSNIEGCIPWTGTPYTGNGALISRGACNFADKVYYAQQGGADIAIIYNNRIGDPFTMSCGGLFCDPGTITIPSLFISQEMGTELQNWFNLNPGTAEITFSNTGYFISTNVDIVSNYSSRGPSANLVIKPDLVAPGTDIFAQGYAPGATGEDRHLGYGQTIGTSNAAPHVAGAAALLRQIHPDWAPSTIKSALMSTAKYLEIYNEDGSPAQPLDMGAGRLDLAAALDPGIEIDLNSLSFGSMEPGDVQSRFCTITNLGETPETYNLTSLDTSAGFNNTTTINGLTITPNVINLGAFESQIVEVSFDASVAIEEGDHQGYIVLQGTVHQAHIPFWVQVLTSDPSNHILLIDNDFSALLSLPDYASFYKDALDELGWSYDYLDIDQYYSDQGFVNASLPGLSRLAKYDAIIYFSGENHYSPGSFSVNTPLSFEDLAILNQYANLSRVLIVMGQDFSQIAANSFFYNSACGGEFLQDSVTWSSLPTLNVLPSLDAPTAFNSLVLDMTSNPGGDGADNLIYIDELASHPFDTPSNLPEETLAYTPLLVYPGPNNVEDGTIARLHREKATLERPDIAFKGRLAYCAFGLEGINNGVGTTSRAEFLGELLNWGFDHPEATITNTSNIANSDNLTSLRVDNAPGSFSLQETSRWDFGDGTPFTEHTQSMEVFHTFPNCGSYVVKVEVIDNFGNSVVQERSIWVSEYSFVKDSLVAWTRNSSDPNWPTYSPQDLNGDSIIDVTDLIEAVVSYCP